MRKRKIARGPHPLLKRQEAVANGIAALFYPYAEVVIHDLGSQTIAYIANNLSKRELGDASALEEIDAAVAPDGTMGPYEKLNWDGRRMRSVSIMMRDDDDEPVGVMCINYNVAVFDDMKSVIDTIVSRVTLVAQPEVLFRDDWQERINTFMHTWLRERQLSLATLSRVHRRELVDALFAEGAFSVRSAANYVAKVLGMGRATVYKRIGELRDAETRNTRAARLGK
ncbi:helix-turn-helix transcriptional regulator [Paraburkholderia strydomiana]|uniref:helix-turn-helix transcriptional regulator n=1 Tax=Paraburkholderia strydomiana TaxID=1245417 RepID=UPI00286A40E8|nr:PAS domain-containing protein [Paraburkholderia strydomiana]